MKPRTLVELSVRHPNAATSLRAWQTMVERAAWTTMDDVRNGCASVKIIDGERARFAIRGGAYRLIAAFDFERGVAYIKFFGTHADYDGIDARTVRQF